MREFRPRIKVGGTRTTVMVDQVGAFDLSRFEARVGRVSPTELAAIDDSLKVVLALP